MELKLQKFRIAVVLKSFFFPLTSPEIFEALKKREFEIGRLPIPPPTGPRVYFSGTLARKGSTFIDVDDSRKLIGVFGESIEDTLNVFSEVLNMLEEDFFVNLDKELSYTELIAHYLIKSNNNPFRVLQNSIEVKFKDAIEQVLNTGISTYRISIIPSDVLPSSYKWFEISISPKVTMPTKAYWVEIIFRDTAYDTVTTFAGNLNSIISNLINALEKGVSAGS